MPPFKCNEDFKEGYFTFEAGNTYEPKKYGITAARLEDFYNAGWVEIEGRDKAPDRQVLKATVMVEDAKHTSTAESANG